MGRNLAIGVLVCEWASYLEQRGHRIRQLRSGSDVLVSRNGRGRRYRWLFLHAEGAVRRTTAIEHENLERQARLARKAREKAYLVVKFELPEPRVVVLPAERVAQMGLLRSDKGGIPWEG